MVAVVELIAVAITAVITDGTGGAVVVNVKFADGVVMIDAFVESAEKL